MKGIRTKGSSMVYGEFGLKAEGPGWVSAREIEAARRAITGYVKEVDSYGLDFFLIRQLVQGLQKHEWVEVKEL